MTEQLVSEGRRKVIGISLPKGKPESPMRNVELALQGDEKYPPSGWIFADKLGDIAIGDLVIYKIIKTDDGYKNVTEIAKVSGNGGVEVAASGDARDGGEREPPAPQNTAAPVARDHDSYAYLAACGMVDLAYEELHDAAQVSDWKVSPTMVATVAGLLLDAADDAQRKLIGRTDRNAMSHTRARGAVRTVLRTYPLSDFIESELEEWSQKISGAALTILKIAGTI